MAFLDETATVERLQFFDGMQLFAPDLQGLEAFNREMRWLHNRSLHQPGIGNGFAVRGRKGDREVLIGPGYALDYLGREIVLTRDHVEPIPPTAGEDDGQPVSYDLAVSYPDDEELAEVETRAGVCEGRGATRRREQPDFAWIRLRRNDQDELNAQDPILGRDVQIGRRIILARVEILQCKLNKDVSLAERRNARPSCKPFMAAGRADRVKWESLALGQPTPPAPAAAPPRRRPARPTPIPAAGAGAGVSPPPVVAMTPEAIEAAFANVAIPFAMVLPFAVTTNVDTTTGAFRATPTYTARIKGPRVRTLRGQNDDEEPTLAIVIDGLPSVRQSSERGFHLDVLLLVAAYPQAQNRVALTTFARAALQLDEFERTLLPLLADWQIEWLGVEG
jgi:hypothetical protein